MSDILIRGYSAPASCAKCHFNSNAFCDVLGRKVKIPVDYVERPNTCPLVELPPHGDLIETKDVLLALVEHGQRDKRFKLGDTIRYSPSEVKEIIDASVPVVVQAEKGE